MEGALRSRWVKIGIGGGLLLVAAGGRGGWVLSAPGPAFAEADAARLEQPGDPERGRLVFAASDCGSCHASAAGSSLSVNL